MGPVNHIEIDEQQKLHSIRLEMWMNAAGVSNDSNGYWQRVISGAGEFLQRTACFSEEEVCGQLSEIDFTMPVSVVRLPTSVFVRGDSQYEIWFTDTGLTPKDLQLIRGPRLRKTFTPISVVSALKATARSFRDCWTRDCLSRTIAPQIARTFGTSKGNGGTQYVVPHKSRMREL